MAHGHASAPLRISPQELVHFNTDKDLSTKLRSMFSMLDADANGSLSFEEFGMTLLCACAGRAHTSWLLLLPIPHLLHQPLIYATIRSFPPHMRRTSIARSHARADARLRLYPCVIAAQGVRKLTHKDEIPTRLTPGDFDAITTRKGADDGSGSSSWLQVFVSE